MNKRSSSPPRLRATIGVHVKSNSTKRARLKRNLKSEIFDIRM